MYNVQLVNCLNIFLPPMLLVTIMFSWLCSLCSTKCRISTTKCTMFLTNVVHKNCFVCLNLLLLFNQRSNWLEMLLFLCIMLVVLWWFVSIMLKMLCMWSFHFHTNLEWCLFMVSIFWNTLGEHTPSFRMVWAPG